MDHNTCESRSAINILKTARGQIDGIIKMIDEDRDCIDVSKQVLAVSALLKKANSVILRQHMNTCVSRAISEGSGPDKIDEIMKVIESYII